MDVSLYFPNRNKKVIPVEGINYPKDELYILKTASECDKITDAISSMIPAKLKLVNIYVTNPLFGEQIISFLSNSSFGKVYTYTTDIDLIIYLVENLKLYGLTDRCIINDGVFDGITNDSNYILYIDISWLTSKGFDFFELNGRKIEYWIESCKKCSLISVNIPSNSYIKVVSGFAYSVDQGEDVNKVYYIIPISEKDWKNELQMFIYDFLKIVEPDKNQRKQYITQKNMKLWYDTFTHESYDRINNYEDLEKVGDSLLDTFFDIYLITKYPKMDKEHMTNLRHYYLSEKYLPSLTRKYELVRYIRSSSRLNQKVFEDVFESFFGGLFMVANNVKKNSGFIIAQKMADHMFDDIHVDISPYGPMQSDHKSFILKKVIDRLLKEHQPIETTINDGNRIKTIIKIDNFSNDFFRDINIKIRSDNIIGVGYGNVKKISSRNAWENAYKYLLGLGVNEEFVNRIVEFVKYHSVENYEVVRKKYTKEGFTGIKIIKDIDSIGSFLQLVATRDPTQKYTIILAEKSYSIAKDVNEEYAQLFDIYLKS